MAMAALAAVPAAEQISRSGSKLAGDVAAHIFAALGTPLLSVEQTHVRKGRIVTTKASLPAWLPVGILGIGAIALWVSGMGLRPGTITRTVHHAATGHWEWVPDPTNPAHKIRFWQEDRAAWDEDITENRVIFTERPRMLMPFTTTSGGESTPGLPSIPFSGVLWFRSLLG